MDGAVSTEQPRRSKPLPAKTLASKTPSFATTLNARVLRHDKAHGLSTLFFGDGELRVPLVPAPVDSGVRATIYARDVSIALSRPMDVSITNRLPGTIIAIEPLVLPYVRVTFDLGSTHLDSLVTTESVERLRQWASGRCLCADRPGLFTRGAVAGRTDRKVDRSDPSLN